MVLHGKLEVRRTSEKMILGVQELMREVKMLEDYARACRAGEDMRSVPLTREEVEVVASYRRFMSEQDKSSEI